MGRVMVNIVGGKNLIRYVLVTCIEEVLDESASNGLALFGLAINRTPLLAASYPTAP